MEESQIKRTQFLGRLQLELWATMAYAKETGMEGKKADYGQLLRTAWQLEHEAKANGYPQSYGSTFSKKALAQGVSARMASVGGEENIQVHMGIGEQEDEIGACPDLDESFPGVSIQMARVVQHYKKVKKRCFICNDPSYIAQDCSWWEEFHSQNLNGSEGLGEKGTQTFQPKTTD